MPAAGDSPGGGLTWRAYPQSATKPRPGQQPSGEFSGYSIRGFSAYPVGRVAAVGINHFAAGLAPCAPPACPGCVLIRAGGEDPHLVLG